MSSVTNATRTALAVLISTIVTLFGQSATAQSQYDGKLFDQGRTMTERSPRADSTLDQMANVLGQWEVAVTTFPTDTTEFVATGTADVTYMNRGYAYMERLNIPSFDAEGNSADNISFLVFQPATQQWALGEGSSYTEHIEVYNGAFEGSDLVLTGAVRRRGGMQLTDYRVTYSFDSPDSFRLLYESSTDGGANWTSDQQRLYTRRVASPDFMATRADHGKAAEDRLPEAAQFDFLIGSWTAQHELRQGGNPVRFPTNATAVFVMDGQALLEHSWFDLDPNLPDAATTILRLYNRAERRWESLYMTNRWNGLLDFGGQWEGDRMVLHNFETHRGDPISHYVFHSIEQDHYEWFAETSNDRGKTFTKTWLIDFTRN